jgi:hypothetical protein
MEDYFKPALQALSPDSSIMIRLSKMGDPILYNLQSLLIHKEDYKNQNVVFLFGEDYLTETTANGTPRIITAISKVRSELQPLNIDLSIAVMPRIPMSATSFDECLRMQETDSCAKFIPPELRNTNILQSLKDMINETENRTLNTGLFNL